MKRKRLAGCMLVSISVLLFAQVATATSFTTSFTKLSGLSGGSPAATAVYRADLSGIASSGIQSLTITDNSYGLGGAAGQFSGFDLDAIMLSTDNITNAASINTATTLNVFEFVNGSIFTPGIQRTPVGPKLFGTNSLGNKVDNAVATLGSFDGNSTTSIPGAFGFLSMGDGGSLSLNFTSLVNPSGLYLYIGEVGDNGEVAASSIIVSDTIVPVPAAIWLLGSGLAGLAATRLRRKKQ